MPAKNNVIRLGVIGMGLSNMASTFTLLKNIPDLRYQITAMCALPAQAAQECAEAFKIPYWTTDYRELVSRA